MSVIARAVFTGRTRARIVGDADPYGFPARWMSAWRRGEGTPPYRERHGNRVGADARIVPAARRTSCRAACPHAAVAVCVRVKQKISRQCAFNTAGRFCLKL